MAILEKFKYYSGLLFQYLSTRFGLLKYSVFAILLCLLSVTKIPESQIFVENVIFIFFSLFAFRLLDDAFSYYLDRIHYPQRTYLSSRNIKSFIVFTFLAFIIYQIGLFLFSWFLAITILTLFLFSTGLYILFFKAKGIMAIIPLLKYPVLVWCISRFSLSSEVFLLSVGAFFMMLTSDFIDDNKLNSALKIKILLISITGILIFQPWIKGFTLLIDIVLISIPIFLISFTSLEEEPVFPVVIFPVLHLFDLIKPL